MINFEESLIKGNIGEIIFKNDFLDFLNIKYEDVTGCQKFQIIDSDYLSKIGLCEIKTNYKDNKILIFEEYTNCNEELGKISLGWLYKSKADLMVFISKETRTMVFLPFTDMFKKYYKEMSIKYELIKNQFSYHKNNKWQSAFKKILFSDLNGYISIYKKV